MRKHDSLRAYMAGVLIPSIFMLFILCAYVVTRLALNWEIPIERAIVFPMAIVPNLWGIWNLIYHAAGLRGRIPLGVFGSLLVLLLVPSGIVLASFLELPFLNVRLALIFAPVGMAAYYLIWKHAVSFLNRVAGIE